MMPHADKAMVAQEKILDYLLNVSHPVGGAKANYFRRFGFTVERWIDFAAALQNHPLRNPLKNTEKTRHGIQYGVQCRIATPDGRNPCIVTVWIDDGNGVPRLVTSYPV